MSLESLQHESPDHEVKRVMFENVRDLRPLQEVEVEFEESGKRSTEKILAKDLMERKPSIMRNKELRILHWDVVVK